MKKPKKTHLKDFELIPNTAGVILNGIYIKKDKSELIIQMAWGGTLHFRPLKDDEVSL